MKDLLLIIYKYRWFILGSVKREFQVKYRTSMLGAMWLILQPLAMILVYTLVFSQVMKTRLPG
ncbi:ABC transporter permease, partial [Citrobacter youngae]|nr:ABC transporter permease [Citrobacter youngae]